MKHNKLFIAILLFTIHCSLFIVPASAQSWQELMDSTNSYRSKRDYQTALIWAKKTLTLAASELKELDTNYLDVLNDVIISFWDLREIDSALAEYQYSVWHILQGVS